jgi:hypothetical protein
MCIQMTIDLAFIWQFLYVEKDDLTRFRRPTGGRINLMGASNPPLDRSSSLRHTSLIRYLGCSEV